MSFSNTYTTNPGSASSNREDLTDVLSILAPEETPILSSLSKQKASATNVEWTVDGLAPANTTGVREGADVGQTIGDDADAGFVDQFAGRARLGNYIQKFRRAYQVSDLQEAVDSVGPAKVAQAEAKSIRELKRDIEATLASANDKTVEDGINTGYGLRGLGGWINSAGPADVPATYRTPASSIYTNAEAQAADFSESALNGIITSIFEQTGSTNDLMLVADTGLRRVISDFARTSGSAENSVRNVNYNGGSGEITLRVDLYESDHGVVSIVNGNPSCMPNFGGTTSNSSGYLINPEYAGIHELIPLGSTRLPNQGGGERGYVDCALTLGVYQPQAHGLIQDVQ